MPNEWGNEFITHQVKYILDSTSNELLRITQNKRKKE